MKMFGPFDVEAVVYFTDGEQVAKATYRMERGSIPSLSDYRQAAVESETLVKGQMGRKWRLCTKREYFDALTAERTGVAMQFALPGGDEWDNE